MPVSNIKWDSKWEAERWLDAYFFTTASIVAGDKYRYDERGNYNKVYEGRAWFRREYNKHRLHPAVYDMMLVYVPTGWENILLEWPHKAETDPNRIAYTRDERSGEADRQVVTTIGKYLTRHFPQAASDHIRDIVAKHTYGGQIEIVRDIDKMVSAVMNGPRSCMSPAFNLRCDDGKRRHPYAVYDPSLGWSMAVRYDGTDVMGRCLVWQDPDNADTRGFVRSYKRERDSQSNSGADEAIEIHLRNLGYSKWGGWQDSTPIMQYSTSDGGFLMPYIDGCTQCVDHAHGDSGFIITDGGEFEATTTNGRVASHDNTCEDCGEGMDNCDTSWVGVHEDRCVCQGCIENYTYVYGRRGNQYYVEENEAVYVDDEYYDCNYLSDNNIVELHCGDYAHSDNAVFVESQDEYYRDDDDDICYAEDTNRHELVSDCWQCHESGNWYTDDEESVEIDGEVYHPDHAPEQDEETETN
jgi:hypothetical protein